jgi:hypothetical protein
MAKPKLALIPAAQGTKFYSVLPSDGTGDFDFTRGSKATRINAQGLIEIVNDNISRLDYPLIDGVQKGCPHHILEPARANLLSYSNDFSNAAWSKGSNLLVQLNTEISPDGSLNATKFTNVAASSVFAFQLSIGSTSSVWTSSVFVKKGTNKYCGISITSLGITNSRYQPVFNLEDGTIQEINTSGTNITNASNSITQYPNGWYRVTISVTFVGGADQCYMVLQNTNNTDYNPVSGTLDWQNASLGNAYFYGAMLEQGSYPTSYIPTTSTAVTRSAETANGAGNSTTFNSEQGVLMAEISAESASDSSFRFISLNDGTSNNVVKFVFYLNMVFAETVVGGVNQGNTTYIFPSITSNNKIAFKYKVNDFALWVNGIKVSTDLLGSVLASNILNNLSFDNGAGNNNFYGKTKQIQYFDSALDSEQLEQLTSWQSFRDMANGQLYTIE